MSGASPVEPSVGDVPAPSVVAVPWQAGLVGLRLAADVQSVIWLRLSAFSAAGPAAWHEMRCMLDEKPRAFAASALAMGIAAAAGQGPDRIATAALGPLQARVSDNLTRLRRPAGDAPGADKRALPPSPRS